MTDDDTEFEADVEPDGAMQVERSWRGISQRLAVRYLGNLGGEHVAGSADGEGEDVVEGDDWTARVTSETVDIGVGSLQLTEVTVAFEGHEETLPELVDSFAQKAMRAGG